MYIFPLSSPLLYTLLFLILLLFLLGDSFLVYYYLPTFPLPSLSPCCLSLRVFIPVIYHPLIILSSSSLFPSSPSSLPLSFSARYSLHLTHPPTLIPSSPSSSYYLLLFFPPPSLFLPLSFLN